MHSPDERSWLLAFYFFMALATLAKGPIAVFLAGAIILFFAVLRRDGRLMLRTLWPIGIALYLAVAAPWFIAVQHANPEFFRTFFLQHNLERFSSNLYHHPQPFWFYIPVALLALVPWTVFVVRRLSMRIRDWRFSMQQPPGRKISAPISHCGCCCRSSSSRSRTRSCRATFCPAFRPEPSCWPTSSCAVSRSSKPAMWMIVLHALLSSAMLIAAFIVPFKLLKLALPER